MINHTMAMFLAEQMQLKPGENRSALRCPFCQAEERSFSMKRERMGILYNCYRAKCGVAGFMPTGQLADWGSTATRGSNKRRLHKLLAAMEAPSPADTYAFQLKYNVPAEYIERYVRRTSQGEYALRVLGPYSEHRGWVTKRPWVGAPLQSLRPDAPKTISYIEEDCSGLAWVHSSRSTSTVYLVEDIISAMRVTSDTNHTTVALCGTTLNQERVDELRRAGVHTVNLWLDYDARQKAYKYASKWGLSFNEFRVIVTKDDPKDCKKVQGVE